MERDVSDSKESEANRFEGIATGDESSFRYSYPSSKIVARSPAQITPITRQAIGSTKTMITLFPLQRNRSLWMSYAKSKVQSAIFHGLHSSGFEKGTLGFSFSDARVNFVGAHGEFDVSYRVQGDVEIPEASCVPVSTPTPFAKHNPCDFGLFGILKRILKDQAFNSSDETEETTAPAWDDLIFDHLQGVFRNWMNYLA
jgi:hypothetical protein